MDSLQDYPDQKHPIQDNFKGKGSSSGFILLKADSKITRIHWEVRNPFRGTKTSLGSRIPLRPKIAIHSDYNCALILQKVHIRGENLHLFWKLCNQLNTFHETVSYSGQKCINSQIFYTLPHNSFNFCKRSIWQKSPNRNYKTVTRRQNGMSPFQLETNRLLLFYFLKANRNKKCKGVFAWLHSFDTSLIFCFFTCLLLFYYNLFLKFHSWQQHRATSFHSKVNKFMGMLVKFLAIKR